MKCNLVSLHPMICWDYSLLQDGDVRPQAWLGSPDTFEWVVRAQAKAKAGVRFPTVRHALSELPTWGTLSHRGIRCLAKGSRAEGLSSEGSQALHQLMGESL